MLLVCELEYKYVNKSPCDQCFDDNSVLNWNVLVVSL